MPCIIDKEFGVRMYGENKKEIENKRKIYFITVS
jgi:hypothetical protein